MNPYKKVDLKKFIESIPQDEFDKQIRIQEEAINKDFKEFSEKLGRNVCFLCDSQVSSFNEQKPCYHWFTYPKGIKKRHFKNYLLNNPISFFRLDSYFRWLANSEKPIANINDLRSEMSESSYIETTIRYRNIEWAFSLKYTDKEGHRNSYRGNIPHYHLQMKVDERIFIKFSDFHIHFTDEDLFMVELLEQAHGHVALGYNFGQGINIIEDADKLSIIDRGLTISNNEEDATFRRQTFIEAPEGKTISGELIYKAIMESRVTKMPIGRILQKYLDDATITVFIAPGDGVPKMVKRIGKK